MQTSVAPDINAAALPPEISRPELSKIVRLDAVTPTANTLTIDATVRECMALAARFELSYVRSLSAEITYRRTRGGQMARLDGRITAAYGQLCGITLAPMPLVMEETFQTEYTLDPWEQYSEFDLDQPEILTDDFIDIGEVVAEYFGLAIDPYAARAGTERLPELTQYLSATVQELLAAAPPEPAHVPPILTETAVTETVAPEARGETIEFLTAAPEPVPVTEALITTAEPEETADEPKPPTAEPQHESLFMKYLRKLQAA